MNPILKTLITTVLVLSLVAFFIINILGLILKTNIWEITNSMSGMETRLERQISKLTHETSEKFDMMLLLLEDHHRSSKDADSKGYLTER